MIIKDLSQFKLDKTYHEITPLKELIVQGDNLTL